MSNKILGYIAIAVLLIFTTGNLFSQQEYTMHFNRDMIQSNYYNPSFQTEYKVVIALPSIAYNYGNNAFSYNDIIKKNSDDSTYLDVGGVIDNMEENNILQMQMHTDILAVMFHIKQWHITLSLSEKFDLKFTYPKELINLIWNGNAQFIGKTVEIGPAVDFTLYKEIAVGVGRDFGKLDLGARLKLLNGIANVTSSKSDLALTTGDDIYELTFSSDYEVKTSGLDVVEDEITNPTGFTSNYGLGLDLGGNYKFNEKLEVSLSVLDLGGINWKDNVTTYKSNGTLKYEGADIADLLDEKEVGFDKVIDSLKELYFEEEDGGSYTSYLVPKVYASVFFRPIKKARLGALVNVEFFDGIQYGIALHGGYYLGKFLDVGLTYSIKNRSYTNLGFNLGIGPRAFKIYVVTDNLLNFLRAADGRNVTFRYAMNINIGHADGSKKEKKVKKEKEEETSLLYYNLLRD